MDPPGAVEVAVHSDYTPITILLRLQNKIIDFTDFQVPIRSTVCRAILVSLSDRQNLLFSKNENKLVRPSTLLFHFGTPFYVDPLPCPSESIGTKSFGACFSPLRTILP